MVGPNPEVGDIELLQEVALAPDPIVTANEVAERTGYTRQNVKYRFDKLVQCNFLARREVGSRAVVYWLTDEGRDYLVENR